MADEPAPEPSELPSLRSASPIDRIPLERDLCVLLQDHPELYRGCDRRLFLLDYDGTLTDIVVDPETALLTDDQIRTLQRIQRDPKNQVFILSGRDADFLARVFRDIPDIGIYAEHGAFYRPPGGAMFNNCLHNLDLSWMSQVEEAFQAFCLAVPRSRVEVKRAAVVWHYRENEALGLQHLGRFLLTLEYMTLDRSWPVSFTIGKCIVEARPQRINKGFAVDMELDKSRTPGGAGGGQYPGFIFCAGDDYTDEDMFKVLNMRQDVSTESIYTAHVSPPHTSIAFHYFEDPGHVWRFLRSLLVSDHCNGYH